MRSNLPVSQREFSFSPDETLVSVTDLKGRITYCNPAFIHVSGFAKDELLGQPHNLVRHPDMPQEAFRDMWDTIQKGLPWTGLVKNRRKNGDHYWVQANATPMMDGGKITGFLSVRTVPSREAVQGAEKLYAGMREAAASGNKRYALQAGKVIRVDAVGKLLHRLSPSRHTLSVLVQFLMVAIAVLPFALMAPLGVSVTVAVVAALLGIGVSSQLSISRLETLVADANHLASGDLSHPITVGAAGELGQLQQALNQLSVNLRTVVHDVRQDVHNLGVAVQEIASGNQDLSSRTEAQASSLEQTVASMEEINGTIQNSAQSAQMGAKLARETSSVTQRSHEAVQAVATTMTGISDSSKRIVDIVALIEGVAFQTNILALNAAVEAARAGEAGRGFAVVATEVRALAQRAANAAKDIKQLIAESADRVAVGAEKTNDARTRMDDAMSSVQKVTEVLDEISNATSEQKIGIAQINEAVSHMDSITQQNAAMVEELAAAAKSLYGQVEGVSNSMRLFRLARGEVGLSQIDAVALRRDTKVAALARD